MEEVRVWTWRATQLVLALAVGAIALLAWSSWAGAAPSQAPPLGTLVEPVVGSPDPLGGPLDPVVRPVSAVADAAAPIVEHVAAPVSEQAVEPVAPTVVEPVVAPVVERAAPVAAPIVGSVTEPVIDVAAPLAELAAPLADAVEPVVQPVAGPVAEVVEPVVRPVAGPTAQVIEPLVGPVAGPVAEVISPASEPPAGSLGPQGELLASPAPAPERPPAGSPIPVPPLAVPAWSDDPVAATLHATTNQIARGAHGSAGRPAAAASSPTDQPPGRSPAPDTGTSLLGALAAPAGGASGLTGLDLPLAVLGGTAALLALAALGARRTASAPHPEPSSLIVVPPG